MKAQNAHEDTFIVISPSHSFDEVNMRVLCTLTAGVIRVAPHDDLSNLVQYAMGLIKIPISNPPSRHICLEDYSSTTQEVLQP